MLERGLLVVCSVYVFGLAGVALAELPRLLADGIGNAAFIVLPVSLAGLHIATVMYRKATSGAIEAALLMLMFLFGLANLGPAAMSGMSEASTVSRWELFRDVGITVMNLLTAAIVIRISAQARPDARKTHAGSGEDSQLTMLQRAHRSTELPLLVKNLRLVSYVIFGLGSLFYMVSMDRGRAGALLGIACGAVCFGLSCLMQSRQVPKDRF